MKFRDLFSVLTPEHKAAIEGLLARYKGHLSILDIANGIRIVLENARELFEDAMAMRACGRLARSMALFISSLEEVGKVSVLASMSRIPSSNQRLLADAWESFRSHQYKSTWAVVGTYPDEMRTDPAVITRAACQQFGFADVVERVRQYALYVDYHATEKRWISPCEVSDADVAQWYERANEAVRRAEAFAATGFFSERALELQREVYADFNSTRPRRKDTRPEDLARAVEDGPELAKTYLRRLVEEGIISPDPELNIAGIPLNEFLQGSATRDEKQ
jgi:AbiV family abortive infection protein